MKKDYVSPLMEAVQLNPMGVLRGSPEPPEPMPGRRIYTPNQY